MKCSPDIIKERGHSCPPRTTPHPCDAWQRSADKSVRAPLLLLLVFLAALLHAEDHTFTHNEIAIQLRGVSAEMTKPLEKIIKEQLDQSADTEASSALADDLAFFVRKHYQSQGYLSAAVAWSLENKAIVLTATEGVQQHVGKTTFPGNPGLDEKELHRYLVRPTRERIGRTAKDTPYVEKEIAAGVDLVHRYILSHGYVDCEVAPPVATNQSDGATDITVAIQPGDQWKVGTIELQDCPATVEKTLQQTVKSLEEQTLNEARVENMRRRVEGELQTRGWFVAKVTTIEARAPNNHMNLTFSVVPGPIHHVQQLDIDTNFTKGATRLVRSAFWPTLGHKYDSKRMEAAYGRIVDTGLFEHLEMNPTPVDDEGLVLHFTGEEAKRSSIGVSIGFDTFLGGILGLEYKNVNFWDSGGTLRVKAQGTQLGYLAGIQWKNPALFSSPWALSIDLMPESFTFEGYQRYTAAFRTAVSRDLSRTVSAEAFALVSINSVSSDTLTILELGPDYYELGTAGFAFTYEGRDNPISPTRGWFASLRLEAGDSLSDLSDVAFTRTDFAIAWYQPLSAKWRTAIGAHVTSLIAGEDVGYVPIELRNYNGGAKGVRSFEERRLGPSARDGTPLGGTQAQTVSGEISYEIVKNLELAGFVDAGSLSTEKGEWLPNFSDLRYAAGIGIRYRLPFGPLRVDYGVNLNRREGEDFGALHIGFGFAF